MELSSALLSELPGIGPSKAKLLEDEINLITIENLLLYKPRRYIDRSSIKYISDIKCNGDEYSIIGTVTSISEIPLKNRRILKIEISDPTGKLYGTFFGGIKYIKNMFNIGDEVIFSGKPKLNYRNIEITHPEFDFISEEGSINTSAIVPVYPLTQKLRDKNINSRFFRKYIKYIFNNYSYMIVDPIKNSMINNFNYLPYKESIENLHFPTSFAILENARKRLAFTELFFLYIYTQSLKKIEILNNSKSQLNRNYSFFKEFVSGLPFQLTNDQSQAIDKLTENIFSKQQMKQLLQGDVGSGKTVVAIALSMYYLAENCQCVFMAPTEVLANQHYIFFKNTCRSNISVALLTGSTSKKEKLSIYNQLKNGEISMLFGTHAVFQKDVIYKNLRYIVIDEQHRFGVEQRAELIKKGNSSDLLVMTATPIPRSLALTLYGDLDSTIIRDKPSNRIPIKTYIFPESRLNGIYNSIDKYISQGRQCYYVLPLIKETEKSDLKSAIEIHKNISKHFPKFKIGLLHGKMKPVEKDTIMNNFKSGDIDILVSTTVIEVGVDVPNANVIVIHHAERFGLSQLHQLRGRVGRGSYESFCILLHPDSINDESLKRLKIIESTDDGFEISENDLKLRGSGYISGLKQHGFQSELNFVSLYKDQTIIENARNEAATIINSLNIEHLTSIIEKHDNNNLSYKKDLSSVIS